MRTALVSVLLLLAVLGGAGVYALHLFHAPGPLPAAHVVVVPRGGLDRVADALNGAGVIEGALPFRAAALATSGQGALRAAEFEFPAHASLEDVLNILRTARPVQHRLTVPEGLTAAQITQLLSAADGLEGGAATIPEGMMLPETYNYQRGTPRSVIAERGRQMMERALDRAWRERRTDLPLASAREALVLASVVERETGKPEERPHIAAVYLNRLRLGMKLQSDPTVAYAASGGAGVLDHGLTRAELDRDDPYNTYRVEGLPPGPICMPGAAALKAATQPIDSDDLYFVADGSGGHVFSHTAEEHNRNVLHWRDVERGREVAKAKRP